MKNVRRSVWFVVFAASSIQAQPPGDPVDWQKVDGGLVQLSADDVFTWGVNLRDEIYRRPIDGSGGWANIPGRLVNVSASGRGWIWGVNRANEIWKCAKPCDAGSWQRVDGTLAQVSAGDIEVWGIQQPGDLIFARPVDGSGQWRRISGNLVNVSASGKGWIWGVNRNNQVWKCPKPCNGGGEWQQVDGTLAQVDADDDEVWGIQQPGDHIFSRPVDGSGQWQRMPGNLINVTASGRGWIWGVNRAYELFKAERDLRPVVIASGSQSTSPGDVIAPVANAAVLAGYKALGKTVDTGPGKPVSMGTVCTLLQVASTGADNLAEKQKEKEAREQLLAQWAEILYETQQQTGVSVANIDTSHLLNAMASFADQEEVVEIDPAELVPAGYLVNDPGGTLRVGATTIPVDGETNPLVIGKLIVLPGVPGSYKIKDHYLGGPGTITIEPGLKAVPADNAALSTEPEWQSFDVARQVLDIASIADPTGITGVVSAYLHPICGTDEANRSRGDICWRDSDGRGVGALPIACNPALPDQQGGLCYERCEPGYHGVGPVCWTDQQVSIGRGVGVLPTDCPSTHPVEAAGLCYQSCPDGWSAIGTICYEDCPTGLRDDGLYCAKQSYGRGAGYVAWEKDKCDSENADVGGCEQVGLLHYPKCKAGFDAAGCCLCQSSGCPGGWEDIGVSCKKPSTGRGVGVPPNVCPSNAPNLDAGLCYADCPTGYTGLGPVCWTNQDISQGRGVGMVPDQCAPSTPNFDAGLCYTNCSNPDFDPVGPVCWGQCGGRYSAECGAGCATSEAACGTAIAEMVYAPFDMLFTISATIGTFGGYSFVDTAKDSAKVAAKAALKEAAEEGIEIAGKKVGKGIAKGIQKNIDKLTKLSARLASQKELIKTTLTETVFNPAKDLLTRKAVKQAAADAAREAAEEAAEKAGVQLAKVAGADAATGGTAAASVKIAAETAQTATERKLKEAAEEALRESLLKEAQDAGGGGVAQGMGALSDVVDNPPLTLKEIKDRFYKSAAEVSNASDLRALQMVKECAVLGITIDDQWAGTSG